MLIISEHGKRARGNEYYICWEEKGQARERERERESFTKKRERVCVCVRELL